MTFKKNIFYIAFWSVLIYICNLIMVFEKSRQCFDWLFNSLLNLNITTPIIVFFEHTTYPIDCYLDQLLISLCLGIFTILLESSQEKEIPQAAYYYFLTSLLYYVSVLHVLFTFRFLQDAILSWITLIFKYNILHENIMFGLNAVSLFFFLSTTFLTFFIILLCFYTMSTTRH